MLNQLRNRKSIALAGAIFWSAIVADCFAQWGTNASVYTNCVICTPQRKSWGYHQTQWSRWPGALYPDMIQPTAGQPGAEIPPPGMELPPPAQEAETRTPSPTRPPVMPQGQAAPDGAPGGEGGQPQDGMMPEPGATDGPDFQPARPLPDTHVPETPVPPQASPDEAAPAAPPPPVDETSQTRRPTMQRAGRPAGNHNGLASNQTEQPAGPVTVELNAARPSTPNRSSANTTPPRLTLDKVERPLPSMARVRGGATATGRTVVSKEPELIPPALSMRPLDTTGRKPRPWRPTANNPFRESPVRSAGHEEDPSAGEAADDSAEHRAEATEVGFTNRLRRG